MPLSNIDRTEQVACSDNNILIKTTDHCRYYEKHPDTFLWRKECWTCKYSDFGINTGSPTETGLCRYGMKRMP